MAPNIKPSRRVQITSAPSADIPERAIARYTAQAPVARPARPFVAGSAVAQTPTILAADANNVYVAVSDEQRRAAAQGSAAGQDSVFGVPYELDPKIGGGLLALKVGSGDTAWQTPHPPCVKPGCSPAQSAAVSAIPGVVFSGGVDGHLRAYSAKDGRIIWDVDTEREYKTVNGVKANGGSLDESGAVIVGGMLFVNSGYFFQGSAAGNVLLAFSVDGK